MARLGRAVAALAAGDEVRGRGCRLVAGGAISGVPVELACRSAACPSGTLPGAPLPCRRGRLGRALADAQARLLEEGKLEPAELGRVAASLAGSAEPAARTWLAGVPCCPEAVLARLARDWWWEVRAGVASRSGCPEALAAMLARDPVPWVRRAVAENATTLPAVLEALAGDEDFGIRDAVAEHPNAPAGVLERLACDTVWEVRRSIAKRADAPVGALGQLAGDGEHWVRFFVACNPGTPAPVRAALLGDPVASVRAAAALGEGRVGRLARSLALPPGGERHGQLPRGPLASAGGVASVAAMGQPGSVVERRSVSSGARWEAAVGYSRAVRVGSWIAVSGTTAAAAAGGAVGGDDVAAQTREAIRRIAVALEGLGAGLEHVVRTRIYVTDIERWEEVGRVHGDVFGSVRPVTTMVEVSRLVDPALLVEIEADAIVP